MMMRIFVLAVLAAALPSLAMAKPNQTTQTFVKKAEISGEFEVGSSRLAQDKAMSPAVKDFAAMMIKDHTAASEKLRAAAQKEGLSPEQVSRLDDRHAKQMKALESAKPDEFDKLYLDQQRRAHEEAVDLFRSYANSKSSEGAVKQFASETLPTLEEHLKHVKDLARGSSGS